MMKIVNVTHHYTDGWGYQDNLLPKYQKLAGDNVVVITDTCHFPVSMSQEDIDEILKKGDEYTFDGIRIRKMKCSLNTTNSSFFCRGVYRILKEERPDIIFHHGIDSSSLVVSTIYKIFHPKTTLFVDSHADYINQSKNKLWLLCNDSIWLPFIGLIVSPFVKRFFGVSPLRCEYLHERYRIRKKKIGLLPLGGDTELVDSIKDSRDELRKKFHIPTDKFIIVSGGKMGKDKGTLELIEAVEELKESYPDICLLLFGKCDDAVKQKINNNKDIISIGWCNRIETLSLLKLADVAVWPLLHTSLIEDAISCGTPLIVKESGNTSHYIEYDNGIYLKTGNKEELKDAIETIKEEGFYINKKHNAEKMKDAFSYHAIADMIKKYQK